MRFRRAAAVLVMLALTNVARADVPVSADRLKSAAEEFDLGRRAFLAREYASAAAHFESAYRDAPRPEPLRNAIRSRKEAGQLARAASLAEIAITATPDEATIELARSVLLEAKPKLHAVDVACAPACAISIDGRLTSFEESTKARVHVEPGEHTFSFGWTGRPGLDEKITATAAGHSTLNVQAPAPASTARPPQSAGARAATPPVEPDAKKPLPRAVFLVGAALTAVSAGATVWSGIDTINSPGQDAVRRDCAGKNDSCATYQEGRSAQTRTNLLVGTTIGLGVITGAIGLFLTRWSDAPVTASASASARGATADVAVHW